MLSAKIKDEPVNQTVSCKSPFAFAELNGKWCFRDSKRLLAPNLPRWRQWMMLAWRTAGKFGRVCLHLTREECHVLFRVTLASSCPSSACSYTPSPGSRCVFFSPPWIHSYHAVVRNCRADNDPMGEAGAPRRPQDGCWACAQPRGAGQATFPA